MGVDGAVARMAGCGSSGALTPTADLPFAAPGGPSAVQVDASGRFVYIAEESGNTVVACSVNTATGVLARVPGVSPAAGSRPKAVIAAR